MNSIGWQVPSMLLENGGGINPDKMKIQSQSKTTPSCGFDMMELKSDAIKNNTALEPGMLGPKIKVNWKWSNRRWQE